MARSAHRGAEQLNATARFCHRCGQPLPEAAAPDPVGRLHRPWMWIAVAGAFIVLAGAMLTMGYGAPPRASTNAPPVESAAFSPDERVLASGAVDGTVRFWGVQE